MITRRKVFAEFERRDMPITDHAVIARMRQTVGLDRDERVIDVTILTREFDPRRQRFIFEGSAKIAPAPEEIPQSRPSAPRTVWWREGFARQHSAEDAP
ncbi:MAG: hypothetical protein ACLP1W_18710 [Rhodomicrobium sp.]